MRQAASTKSEHVLSSDNGGMAFRDDSLSSSDRIQLKFNQPKPKNPNVATVVHVIEAGAHGVGETYETDS